MTPATCAEEIHIFWPEISYPPSGARSARVRSARVSSPASGSVTPKQVRHSPAMMRGRTARFWSAVPKCASGWVA
jgi:hypothetical protein